MLLRNAEDLSPSRMVDAIVVGTGAAGGVACYELTRAGLKVLALEAGWEQNSPRAGVNKPAARVISGITGNSYFQALPPKMLSIGSKLLKGIGRIRQPVQTRCFAWLLSPGSLVDDHDCPYENAPGTQFDWFRSRQLGGRMIVPGHGRQYYRFGLADLEGGHEPQSQWPLNFADLEPWYAAMEGKLGLRGGNDRNEMVPDSCLSRINPMLSGEVATIAALTEWAPSLRPILGRYAPPTDWMALSAAEGLLTVRTGAVVYRIRYDGGGHVAGVEWFDCSEGTHQSAEAPIVFLCASAFESTRILMMSRNPLNKDKTGIHSDALGRFIMDHAVASCVGSVNASADEEEAHVEDGRCVYVPMMARTRGLNGSKPIETPFGIQVHRRLFGRKRARLDLVGFSPMRPRAENRLSLSSRKDRYGVPVLTIDCRYADIDRAVSTVMLQSIHEASEALGLEIDYISPQVSPPGTGIHECGTARMGSDPHDSVVDPNSECWDVKGLYVTDAATFRSLGAQNPTLTIMALTARAVAHAVRQKKTSDSFAN
jgi:choline dehydrogenase-like flavoprotein